MSELEMAQESLDHVTEAHEHGSVPHAKRAAILIASLAAALALCEAATNQKLCTITVSIQQKQDESRHLASLQDLYGSGA